MTYVGQVLSLTVSTPTAPSPVEKQILFVDTKGIVGDKHYDKDIERSILLTSLDSYLLAQKHNIQIPDHALGENLLIDYNPYTLVPGTRLQIGTAILEISQPCTLCNHLTKIDNKLPKLLRNDRGIFAKVLQSGEIKIGNDIFLLDNEK